MKDEPVGIAIIKRSVTKDYKQGTKDFVLHEQNMPIGKEEFMIRFMKKHEDSKFANHISTEKTDYKNSYTKATFTCSIHGDWMTTPANLMNKGGCPYCVNKKPKITTAEFIKRAKKIHGDLYDYSQTEYIGMNDLVNIICRVHGPFQVRTANHVHPAYDKTDKAYYSGCQKCSNSLRFKKPSQEVLMKQIERESNYKLKRTKLEMSSKDYVDMLLKELVTTGVYMVKNDELDSSKSHHLKFATKFTAKLTNLAIDIITEPLAVSEDFLNYVSTQAMERIVYLGDKFMYNGLSNDSNFTNKLDKLKEPTWKLIDACHERLENGNLQVCITRKEASAFF